jgi:hypothetical protein
MTGPLEQTRGSARRRAKLQSSQLHLQILQFNFVKNASKIELKTEKNGQK